MRFFIWSLDDVSYNPKLGLIQERYLVKCVLHFLMEYITMCLDSTNKLEHWYVRHNTVYCLHPWATCFNLYTGHLQALLYM